MSIQLNLTIVIKTMLTIGLVVALVTGCASSADKNNAIVVGYQSTKEMLPLVSKTIVALNKMTGTKINTALNIR
jgi:hypothetical protein